MQSHHSYIYTTLNQRLIDAVMAGVAFHFAYQLRFDWRIPPAYVYQFWLLLPWLVLGQVILNSALNLYRLVWRYIGLADALILARGYILALMILLAARFLLPTGYADFRAPASTIVMYFVLSLAGAVGVRVLRRLIYEGMPAKAWRGRSLRRVLLIGAGSAGAMLAKEIACRTDVKPVGFLDDDPLKVGCVINGLRILGPINRLAQIVAENNVKEVIICIARVPRETLKKIWAICECLPVRAKIVPSLEEILQGTVNIADYRDVALTDLLGREPLQGGLDCPEVLSAYRGRRILITGGGGSIGSELAYQLATLEPQELVLLDKDENGLNDACIRLRSLAKTPNVYPVVADLRFEARLEEVFSRFRPEAVFHAAAHKHVYLMEMNPCEAVLNNVFGTQNLIRQVHQSGVSRFVLISTDKAVRPTCVMGATKRLCEMMVQAQPVNGNRFCCVRFGNVIGSRGSVVPIFQKQIARKEAITLTHPDAERFLMTIPEAARLLIQAGALGNSGEIFILDMGEPVRIARLARDLVELSGLRPGVDIPIKVTELNRGEKLCEELLDTDREELAQTTFDRVRMVRCERVNPQTLAEKLKRLEAAARQGNHERTLDILADFDIGFRPGGDRLAPHHVALNSQPIEAERKGWENGPHAGLSRVAPAQP